MPTFTQTTILCTSLALMASGCSSSTTPQAQLDYEGTKYDNVSTAEAEAFADEFYYAIHEGDVAACALLFDMDEVLAQVTAGVDVPQEFRKGFLNGARSSIQSTGLLAQLIQAVQAGASYELLRMYEQDGEQHAVFRMLMEEGGVNYHDFRIVRTKAGKVAAVDTQIAATGENFTRTLRRMYISAARSANRSALERLAGADADAAAASDLMVKMAKEVQSANVQKIVNLFEAAPESVQKDKSLLLMYCQAAMQTENDATYMKALEMFRRHHPDDPAVEFLSLDWLTMKERYDDALKSLDKINESIGGDGYLDSLRAELLYTKGDIEAALQTADKSMTDCPDLINPYWTALGLNLQAQKWTRVTELLIALDQKFEMEFEDLRTVPEYAGYAATPEHQRWLDHLGGR
ncbi:MAG: hypothetical protein NXI04_04740 [Planctomycetaceae bacterium]|nr:hypothetical protein [Planctomycetaceae bacterium]